MRIAPGRAQRARPGNAWSFFGPEEGLAGAPGERVVFLFRTSRGGADVMGGPIVWFFGDVGETPE